MVLPEKDLPQRFPECILGKPPDKRVYRLKRFPQPFIVKQVIDLRLLQKDSVSLHPDPAPEDICRSGVNLASEKRHVIPGDVQVHSPGQDLPCRDLKGIQIADTQRTLNHALHCDTSPIVKDGIRAGRYRLFEVIVPSRIISHKIADRFDAGSFEVFTALRADALH